MWWWRRRLNRARSNGQGSAAAHLSYAASEHIEPAPTGPRRQQQPVVRWRVGEENDS